VGVSKRDGRREADGPLELESEAGNDAEREGGSPKSWGGATSRMDGEESEAEAGGVHDGVEVSRESARGEADEPPSRGEGRGGVGGVPK
jgi:hypothetical protein